MNNQMTFQVIGLKVASELTSKKPNHEIAITFGHWMNQNGKWCGQSNAQVIAITLIGQVSIADNICEPTTESTEWA